MTLGENKKLALGLIEEYSKTNPQLTDDADIATRLNFIYATNYQDLANKKKILKTKTLKEISDTVEEDGYTQYILPSNMYQFKRIIALDEKNNIAAEDYYQIGKNKIFINNQSNFTYILEYYAYPTMITDETDDDFTLEIDLDAQMILPYMVASDVLKTDPSADYTAFMKEYQRKISELNTSLTTPRVVLKSHYRL